MELNCKVKTYEWGKLGAESEAALLARANDSNFEIHEEAPYAELWMGTHPSGPSQIASTGEALHEWIDKNPSALGSNVTEQFGVQLPFLFKVLSVNKALSIQVHPSKSDAEELHQQFPDIYKDPNHKPELAIALTPFEALCGFRPLEEIREFFNRIRELRLLVGQENLDALMSCSEDCQQEMLQKCFHTFMSAGDEAVCRALDCLMNRISSLEESSREMLQADLVERLNQQFPGDVGIFGPYWFNHITLQPGEAIYLPANEPHAYLSGDCVECMACSDNVVRAGLTPKLKDVPTLCRLLSYACEPGSSKLFAGVAEDDHATIYRPPVPDFAVAMITVPEGETYKTLPRNSASICLVVDGSASCSSVSLRRGSVVFLPAFDTLTFTVTSSKSLFMFQAMANV